MINCFFPLDVLKKIGNTKKGIEKADFYRIFYAAFSLLLFIFWRMIL